MAVYKQGIDLCLRLSALPASLSGKTYPFHVTINSPYFIGILLSCFMSVLILSFILQMAVTDALTGLLPGTFTRRFLIAGMLSQITTDIWWFRTTEFATAAIVLFCLHKLVNRHRLNIGTGDLWLIAGITAWSGLYNAIWCVLLGTGGFVLWHSTWCIKGHKEGPLGPWLCFGHVLLLLDNLYQPLWVI